MKKVLLYVSILIVSIISMGFESTKVYATKEDIYDVVLFWGQSNMAGSAGNLTQNVYYKDTRVNKIGIDEFSKITEIDKEILKNYSSMNHVDVPVVNNTVFDYKLLGNYLEAITKDTTTIGENIPFMDMGGGSYYYKSYTYGSKWALGKSMGTNMMPYFGKTYYEKTGHKVVIIAAGFGGRQIATFLPYERSVAETISTHADDVPSYSYEAMVFKYKSAVNYLQSSNYKIGHKFYVMFIGESDAYLNDINKKADENRYVKIAKEIHNDLKKDIGIEFGVVIETSNTMGTSEIGGIETVHKAQERLINENSDIILGSNYPYRKYVGKKHQYSGSNYEQALQNAYLSVCVKDGEAATAEAIHFNSAALSQIGKEAAINAANYINRDKILGNGDVNGDGKINTMDYILIRKHIIGNSKLTGDNLIRGDISKDGKINTTDYILIRKAIISGKTTPA